MHSKILKIISKYISDVYEKSGKLKEVVGAEVLYRQHDNDKIDLIMDIFKSKDSSG